MLQCLSWLASAILNQKLRVCFTSSQKALSGSLPAVPSLGIVPAQLLLAELGRPLECLAVEALLQTSSPSALWPGLSEISRAITGQPLGQLYAPRLSRRTIAALWPHSAAG